MTELSTNEEIRGLQSLSQSAAAWLVNLSARSLRDMRGLPRGADGTYSARDVLQWAVDRRLRAILRDCGSLPANDILELLSGTAMP